MPYSTASTSLLWNDKDYYSVGVHWLTQCYSLLWHADKISGHGRHSSWRTLSLAVDPVCSAMRTIDIVLTACIDVTWGDVDTATLAGHNRHDHQNYMYDVGDL